MTSSMPRITIVTVVRNAARELEKTIESVLSQDYPLLEFIIIDGGSDDGTPAVIRARQDRLAYWVSEPDHGIYDAMNKGLLHATGDWVNFMNAGDEFPDPSTVSKVFAEDLDDCTVVYGDSYASYAHGKVFREAGSPERLTTGMVFCHQAAFVRRELITEQGFDLQYPIGADFNILFSLYASGRKFKKLPMTVAVFDASGVSNRKMLQSAVEHYRIVRKYHRPGLGETLHHVRFICWVGMVSAGYRLLPEKLVKRLRAWRWGAKN